MLSNKKILFIINKFSGEGYQPSIEKDITDAGLKAGYECTLAFTQDRGHATELAKNASLNQYYCVVAVGGDGTVNEVAKGIIGTNTIMGILPKGSGNGLAHHLGIPLDFKKSLPMIFSDHVITIDTFLVNSMLSINVSGIGFDGHVASLFERTTKRGLMGYCKIVLTEFRKFPEFEAELILHNKKEKRTCFIIALANSSQFGNNARIAPQASVCDQLIDVCIIKKIPTLQSIGFIFRLFAGYIHRSNLVEIMQASHIQIKLKKPIAIHIDGEAHSPSDHIDVNVQPASLRIVVPEKRIEPI